ncbi:MAG: hypothetical protein ABSC63_01610 [Candidatus Binataceae bacterium]|jgi:hypothetical protein
MTTSQTQSFLTEILQGERIPVGKLEYFRARLQSRLHQLVLAEFLRQEDRGLHQAELARRIGRKPEVVNRLLGAPGNWTLNTVSDLLLGMGVELELAIEHLRNMVAQDAGANLIEGMRTGQSANTIPTPQPAPGTNMKLDISTDLNKPLKTWMQELPFGAESTASAQSAPRGGAMPDSIKALQKQTISRTVAHFPYYNVNASGQSQKVA